MSNPTELPDLDKLEALAKAAQISILRMGMNGRPNDYFALMNAMLPETVLALIALARRAQPEGDMGYPISVSQPEGEAPQAVPCYGVYRQHHEENDGKEFFFCSMWHNETNWGAGHRVVKGRFVPDSDVPAATLSPLCGAQHAESGKEVEPCPIFTDPYKACLSVACAFDHDSRERYAAMSCVQAVQAALAAQQSAAPGALTRDALAQMLVGKHVNDYGYHMLLNGEEIGFNLDNLLDIVKTAAPSAPAKESK